MKIYVGNLPFSVDEDKLREIFKDFELEEATIIRDKYKNDRSKGFGFVVVNDDEAAKKLISEFNEKEVEGRKLTVNEARPMDPDKPRRSFGGGNQGGFGGGRGREGRNDRRQGNRGRY